MVEEAQEARGRAAAGAARQPGGGRGGRHAPWPSLSVNMAFYAYLRMFRALSITCKIVLYKL